MHSANFDLNVVAVQIDDSDPGAGSLFGNECVSRQEEQSLVLFVVGNI